MSLQQRGTCLPTPARCAPAEAPAPGILLRLLGAVRQRLPLPRRRLLAGPWPQHHWATKEVAFLRPSRLRCLVCSWLLLLLLLLLQRRLLAIILLPPLRLLLCIGLLLLLLLRRLRLR